MYDLIIRNGTIVDGTGADARTRRRGDRRTAVVAAVGAVDGEAAETVDADGHARHARLRRHPHPLRRPGHLGRRARRRPPATASPRSSSATAASASPPSRPEPGDWLIELMEGVEDIPGTALAEGMTWDWETFPEYLDVARRRPLRRSTSAPRSPTAPCARYVMGERGARNEPATPEDIAEMARHRQGGDRGRRDRLLDVAHARPPGHGRRAGARHLRRRGRAVRHRPGAGRGRPRACSSSPRPAIDGEDAARPVQGDRLDAPPRRGDPADRSASPCSSSTRPRTCGVN